MGLFDIIGGNTGLRIDPNKKLFPDLDTGVSDASSAGDIWTGMPNIAPSPNTAQDMMPSYLPLLIQALGSGGKLLGRNTLGGNIGGIMSGVGGNMANAMMWQQVLKTLGGMGGGGSSPLSDSSAGTNQPAGLNPIWFAGIPAGEQNKMFETGAVLQNAAEDRPIKLLNALGTMAYHQALASGMAEERARKAKETQLKIDSAERWQKQLEGWNKWFNSDGSSEGAVKPPKILDRDTFELIKGMPVDDGRAVINKLLSEGEKGKMKAHIIDHEAGEIRFYDKDGMLYKTEKITPKREPQQLGDKLGAYDRAFAQASSDYYKELVDSYIKGGGNMEGLRQLQIAMAPAGKNPATALFDFAPPELKAKIRKRSEEYLRQTFGGTGGSYAIPGPTSGTDVSMEGINVDREKAKKLAIDLTKKLGRTPTPEELANEYRKVYGGK